MLLPEKTNTPLRFFITGTNTGVGKTYIGEKILQHYNQKAYRTLGLKPIASESIRTDEGLRTNDALILQKCFVN